MRTTHVADADHDQNPSKAKPADEKPKSLLDALRDPHVVKDKDFEPDRVKFGDRDVKFWPLSA